MRLLFSFRLLLAAVRMFAHSERSGRHIVVTGLLLLRVRARGANATQRMKYLAVHSRACCVRGYMPCELLCETYNFHRTGASGACCVGGSEPGPLREEVHWIWSLARASALDVVPCASKRFEFGPLREYVHWIWSLA